MKWYGYDSIWYVNLGCPCPCLIENWHNNFWWAWKALWFHIRLDLHCMSMNDILKHIHVTPWKVLAGWLLTAMGMNLNMHHETHETMQLTQELNWHCLVGFERTYLPQNEQSEVPKAKQNRYHHYKIFDFGVLSPGAWVVDKWEHHPAALFCHHLASQNSTTHTAQRKANIANVSTMMVTRSWQKKSQVISKQKQPLWRLMQ